MDRCRSLTLGFPSSQISTNDRPACLIHPESNPELAKSIFPSPNEVERQLTFSTKVERRTSAVVYSTEVLRSRERSRGIQAGANVTPAQVFTNPPCPYKGFLSSHQNATGRWNGARNYKDVAEGRFIVFGRVVYCFPSKQIYLL